MKYIVALKYGELVLKGQNRGRFERLLIRRVESVLKTLPGNFTLKNSQSTLLIRRGSCGAADDTEEIMGEVALRMQKVFGVVSVCLGVECEKDMDAIQKAVYENAPRLFGDAATFKCAAKRADKAFPFVSPEICDLCGGVAMDALPHLRVDVNAPELVLHIEIRDDCAIIHPRDTRGGVTARGAGGMPTGSNGRGTLLLSGGIDSSVAGYMIAKRGVEVDAVYFETPPYTGESAFEKVKALAGVLASYTGKVYLSRVCITEIQKEIAEKCPERLFTLLLRRFMMRIAEKIALQVESSALITGESLGQVASQTMDALRCTGGVVHIPVFRPCIGLDKEEIITVARRIGTFDISLEPFDDCCLLFTPKHPKLNPTPEELGEAEEALDVKVLVETAAAGRIVTVVRP